MSENSITIDLSKEITQAEYCRRTGDTLPNLATKLKKMAVREIPELGIKLIDISAPSYDAIRIEAPAVREYTISELSGVFGNLLAKFKTDDEVKDAKIQSLERLVEEMTSRLETIGDELDQQRQLTIQLDTDNQQKEEALRSKDTYLEEIERQHTEETARISTAHVQALKEAEQRGDAALTDLKVSENMLAQLAKNYQEEKLENEKLAQVRDGLVNENTLIKTESEKRISEIQQAQERIVSDLKIATFSLDEKEKANQELKAELVKVRQERESLQNRLLDLSKQVSETKISEEFQLFRTEFLSLFKTIQTQASPSQETTTSSVRTSTKSTGNKKVEDKKE